MSYRSQFSNTWPRQYLYLNIWQEFWETEFLIVLHKSIDFQPFPSQLMMPSFSWLFILETWMLSFIFPSPLTLIPKSYWFYAAAAAVTSVVFDSLWPHGLLPAWLFCSWNSPGKNTGVGSHSLLQGIILIQGLNPGFLHCWQILYHLSHQGTYWLYTPTYFLDPFISFCLYFTMLDQHTIISHLDFCSCLYTSHPVSSLEHLSLIHQWQKLPVVFQHPFLSF